jgi:SAM-dependent methyltransferase
MSDASRRRRPADADHQGVRASLAHESASTTSADGRGHWLLVRGRGDRRLSYAVSRDELRAHSSTRRPSVQAGDVGVCYAAGWQSIFAVVQVVGDPENDLGRTRWQWRFRIRPLFAVADLRDAPPVEAAGVFPRSLGRHSYIRLTREQYVAARAAIAAAILGAGYDARADGFAVWQAQIAGMSGPRRAEALLRRLPEHPDVLELGVGAGVAQSRLLAERGRLTGVDVSAEQLRRARDRLPGAKLIHADLTAVDFPPEHFDAVVSFYVLNHVAREALGEVMRRIARWLRPGGWFLATFATSDLEAWQGDFLGADSFFSGYEPEVNEALVHEAGLGPHESELETIEEPEGPARFQWILARRSEKR